MTGSSQPAAFKTCHDTAREFLPLPPFARPRLPRGGPFRSRFFVPSSLVLLLLSFRESKEREREWKFLKRGTDKVSVRIANRG